jgi:hypothetical protein
MALYGRFVRVEVRAGGCETPWSGHAHHDIDGRAFERHQCQIRHDTRAGQALKLCTVCAVLTSRPGSRCTEHARQSNRSRHCLRLLWRARQVWDAR